MGWEFTSVVEHLPNTHEILCSTPAFREREKGRKPYLPQFCRATSAHLSRSDNEKHYSLFTETETPLSTNQSTQLRIPHIHISPKTVNRVQFDI